MPALEAIKQFRFRELAAILGAKARTSNAHVTLPNPFLARKSPESGRWLPPKYSLRRQAELIKHARASNTLHLLPPGPKLGVQQLVAAASKQDGVHSSAPVSTEVWAREVVWEGEVKEKQVPGADTGARLYAGKWRMFKGHKWERMREKRAEELRKALEAMPKRIVGFKAHYNRRRPNPASVPRATTYTKLPF